MTVPHYHHSVPQRHGFGLVVRHIQHGGAERVVQPRDLAPHLHAQLGVEVGERFVEEKHRRLADDRPTEGDALLLAARELPRPLLEQRLDAQDPGGFPDARGDLGAGDAPQLETERHVVEDAHVRVQRVILEHHGDVAVAGGDVVDHAVADAQLPGRDGLQPGHHAQGRALAAPGRADENDELAVVHGQVQIRDGDAGTTGVLVYFADAAERYAGHEER